MSTVTTAPLTPFKGLTPFDDTEQDALLFFGREREREIVVANLMASRLTVLYGPSGVGKTSLLRAGVAYGLREVTDAAVVVFSSWPGDPGIHLREAIAQAIGIPAGESLMETLEQGSHAVGGDIYVILDQFEEYFLYHERAHEGSFAEEFAEAVGAPSLRANFLIGIRDDALANLAKSAKAGNTADVESYRFKSEIAIKASLAYLGNNAKTIDGCEQNPFGINVSFRGPLTEALKQVLINVKK